MAEPSIVCGGGTTVGGTLGLLFAILMGRAAQALLFGLQLHDPVVLVLSTVVLAALGPGSCPPLARLASIPCER